MDEYTVGELFFALRAGLTAKGQAAADDAVLQAALRTPGGNLLRKIAGIDDIESKPKFAVIDGGAT